MNDEFFIGWEDKLPPATGSRVRRTVIVLLVLTLLLGVLLALAQRTIGVSVFEWGTVKSFTGVLKSQPYPHLLVARPGVRGDQPAFSAYYLVKPFKFGLDPVTSSSLDGRTVSLKGTLIHRGNQTMLEVAEGSIKPTDEPNPALAQPVSLGEQTLNGEIVDSKCFLGVMNPGALIPHRACAIRCISGGIPPLLLVRQRNGPPLYLLLTSREGKPVNKEVLNMVAEPVEITGEVIRQGELLVLRSDPSTYRRASF